MSNRITIGIVLLALLVGGIAAYQIHNRKEISTEPGVPTTTQPAEPSHEAANTEPPRSEAAPEPVETKKPAAEPAVATAPPSPIRVGEIWAYSANVSRLNAVANLSLKVEDRKKFLGKNAWHLQAFVHTENPLRMVFPLDDQFDSYSDTSSLVSMQYEMHLNEKGQTVNSVQRMTASNREPAPADAGAARVLPGTRDPLGMMQYLRTVDWAKTPKVRSPVYDGHKLYDVYANLQGKDEKVTVPAGSFNAMKIELRVLDNGTEMKDAHFTLYLTANEARMPVLLEAILPFATARVELVKTQ
jgi:hypothetical protein